MYPKWSLQRSGPGGGAGGRGGRGGGGLGLGIGVWAKLTADLCIADLAVQRLADCGDCSARLLDTETTRYRMEAFAQALDGFRPFAFDDSDPHALPLTWNCRSRMRSRSGGHASSTSGLIAGEQFDRNRRSSKYA